MPAIEIDAAVYKALCSRKTSQRETCNDILREMLELPPAPHKTGSDAPVAAPGVWVANGVRLPEGTEFRTLYNGRPLTGRVAEGKLVMDGEEDPTVVAAAAVAMNRPSVTGWRFWKARLPGSRAWLVIDALRNKQTA